MRLRRLLGDVACVAAVATGIWAGLALLAPGDASAQEPRSEIVDFAILPDVLTVKSGDTITVVNNGGRPHTVTDRGGLFDTDPILPGGTGSFTVSVPGTYEVFCRINPAKMNARVVVEATDPTPRAARIQALDENREGAARAFDPSSLEVPAGTEIVLANVGGLPHSLRAVDDSFRIPVVEPGAEKGRFAGGNASTLVTTPGQFEFYCELHPDEMRGTLVVVATEGALPEVAPDDTALTTTSRAPPGGATATIVDFAFEPSELIVQPGDEVTWDNIGDAPHTATFDDMELDTGPIDPGGSASLAAPGQPGTYSYFCAFHPDMRGALRVAAPAVAAVAPPPSDDPVDGTAFAYGFGAVLVATGVSGLALGLRRR